MCNVIIQQVSAKFATITSQNRNEQGISWAVNGMGNSPTNKPDPKKYALQVDRKKEGVAEREG